MCVCVSTSLLVYLLYAAYRYVGWAVAKGDVCVYVGGGGMDFVQILFV